MCLDHFLTCYPSVLYNQALADVRSTGAGTKCLYCIAALYCSWSDRGRKKEVNLTTPNYHLMGTENFEFWKLCLSSHFAKLWTVVVQYI